MSLGKVFCRISSSSNAPAPDIVSFPRRVASKPVAMTVTFILSPRFSSIKAPKTTIASGSMTSLIGVIASLTSCIPRSPLPEIFTSTPLAPSIDASSRSGLDIAFSVALVALFSPASIPMPMRALPVSDIIVCTSAKSTLSKPTPVIRSDMLWTP